MLTWEDSYEIALILRQQNPEIALDEVSLGMIYQWTIELTGFCDDRALANEEILLSIYQEWYESLKQ